MTRREFLALTGGWVSSAAVGIGQHPGTRPQPAPQPPASFVGEADITLRIGELTLDLAPRRSVRTIGYNGQVPGPLLRARAGRRLTVEVWNDTYDPDIVHWHGFHIPSEVDGAYEEGTPGVAPHGRQRYTFTPDPPGTRWYHSHNTSGRNLKRSTYTGQFGMFVVESGDDPGGYDQEVPILLHEWEPRFSDRGPLDIEFRYFSINGKMLGSGEPIRVRESQRVLFRIVNASATLQHRLALPGHQFHVIALDGNALPSPKRRPPCRSRPRRESGRDRGNEPTGRMDPRRSGQRAAYRWNGNRRRVCGPAGCSAVGTCTAFYLGLRDVWRKRTGPRAGRATAVRVPSHGRPTSLDNQREVLPPHRSDHRPGEQALPVAAGQPDG